MRRAAFPHSTVGERAPGSGGTVQPLALIGGGDGNDPLGGTPGDDQMTGGAGNDTITALAGNDRLDGGAGNDSLIGGTGNDTYVVGSLGDVTVEASTLASEIDTVEASVSWTLAPNIERLVLTGASNLTGTGNALANLLTGNTGNNRLAGAGGDDTLNGGSGNDTLDGGSGNDALSGGAGNDSLIGGAGNDVYVIDGAGDRVSESSTLAGEIDSVSSAVTFTLGANLERLTLTGAGALGGTGNALGNAITGNSGANVLSGADGNDTLVGGSGNDTLSGGTGADSLDGGAGIDAMAGGTGNDNYVVDVAGDLTTETSTTASEIDTVISAVTRTLGPNLENLTLSGTAAISGTGNSLANVLIGSAAANSLSGGAGNDALNGGAGNDTLTGGSGNDRYTVDAIGDRIVEIGTAASEIDSVSSSVSLLLPANVERLTLTGSAALSGTGNAGANNLAGNSGNNSLSGAAGNDTLSGGSGNDTLNGGTQNDAMIGGTGNDTYSVDSAGDTVSEISKLATEIDSVSASVSFVLGANLENLVQSGSSDIFGTGNALANKLTGNGGANILSGEGGNDSLNGGAGNDTLNGGDGVDTLNGGAGNDSLAGGAGNDNYVVDAGGDRVTETTTSASEIDSVSASVSFTLEANVENLLLTGSSVIFGTGNGLNNRLTGNGVANILSGEGGNDIIDGGTGNDTVQGGTGNDSLLGGAGNDTLDGGADRDTLDGGTGNDAMTGGTGNDLYRVDASGDTVSETSTNAAEIDTVEALVSHTLGANVERLLLEGTDSISGTGNALANLITGTTGSNTLTGADGSDTLDGGAGADKMVGGADGDRYVVDDLADLIDETGANTGAVDSVASSVSFSLGDNLEALTLTGAAAISGAGNGLDNSLVGNGAANTLTGEGGNDTMDGGAGSDLLSGGAGNDLYLAVQVDDSVEESADDGFDSVQTALAAYTLGSNLEGLASTGAASFTGTGNELGNLIESGAGNDVLDGVAGSDTLRGGLGNDTYRVDSSFDLVGENVNAGNDTVLTALADYGLGGNIEGLEFTGSGAFAGTGNTLANRITGGAAADTLDGGLGNDTLSGGAGNDIYVVDSAGDQALEAADAGSADTVRSTVSWTLAAHIEELELVAGGASLDLAGTGNALNNTIAGNEGANALAGGEGNDTLQGGGGNDSLAGDNGNDSLVGGAGFDAMTGGAGSDIYQVDAAGDSVNELADGGVDAVLSFIDYTLGSEVENLSLFGSAVIGTGNGQRNEIRGNDAGNLLSGAGDNDALAGNGGNDTLDGGSGNDLLIGGMGNDRFIVDSQGDTVSETAGEGTADEVRTALAAYTLGSDVENLLFTGGLAFAGTGNSGANTITGGTSGDTLDGAAGADMLVGGLGNDTYRVDNAGDTTTESTTAGTDTVLSSINAWTLAAEIENLSFIGAGGLNGTGNALRNTLTGGTGNDTLSGGGERDTLIGGAGNDVYGVDINDTVTELAGGGTDTMQSAAENLELASEVENGTLLGSLNLQAKGNALNNAITGNGGDNLLDGIDGNDSLSGAGGADNLKGGNGNDTLDGGTGDDKLDGGAGNDLYLVDSASDALSEGASSGTDDFVSSLVNWTLGANFENLVLGGGTAINGTGNTQANSLTGNDAVNALAGGDGNDTLTGNGGNDTLTGGAGTDSINGGAGIDNIVLDSKIGSDIISGFVASTDNIAIDRSGILIGDGDTVVDLALTRNGPGLWGAANELVLFTANAPGLTTANAATTIGSSTNNLAPGLTKIFIVDNGTSSGVFLFTSAAPDNNVQASELILLATIVGNPNTNTSGDYVFIA